MRKQAELIFALSLNVSAILPNNAHALDASELKSTTITLTNAIKNEIQANYAETAKTAYHLISKRLLYCSAMYSLMTSNPSNDAQTNEVLTATKEIFGDASAALNADTIPEYKKMASEMPTALTKLRENKKQFLAFAANCKNFTERKAVAKAVADAISSQSTD